MPSEADLNQLEADVTALNEKKIRTEEQLKALRQKKNDIVAEITALGIAPTREALEGKITQMDADISTRMRAISDRLSAI